MRFHPLFPLWLSAATAALAQQPGTFEKAGDTLVSAMMVRFSDRIIHYILTSFKKTLQMFVGSADKVYILDKVEGNAQQINGHSLYASVWLVVPSQFPHGFIK